MRSDFPLKNKRQKRGGGVVIILIIYDNSTIEPYNNSRGLGQQENVGEIVYDNNASNHTMK